MAATYGALGRAVLGTSETTVVAAVPAGQQWLSSSVIVCNTGAAAATYRLIKRGSGSATALADHLVHDAGIGPGETHTLTLGLGLPAAEMVLGLASVAGAVVVRVEGARGLEAA